MMRLILSMLVVAACVPASGPYYTASPTPGGGYEVPAPPAPIWDSSGWTLLGHQTVDGIHDRDVIAVVPYQGRFDQLTMVVRDSDLELLDLVVVFGNGQRWSPSVRHHFREGQRTRAIDLPGDDRVIARIELAYRNLPGYGRASVEVWGRDRGRPLPPPPPPPSWDSSGWTLLGAQSVDGRRDHDVMPVGAYRGRFDQLTMVVTDSDLEMLDLVVVFGNGQRWSPNLRHHFREGQRTRVIDLPGDHRVIARIELAYRNLPGGGRARVEVWGRNTRHRHPRPIF